ncbi:MAG: hypothetical protein GY866_10240 [Proteobacteria bacterium]|nr:hypothetical protein [Pseudomonadota bacterium]
MLLNHSDIEVVGEAGSIEKALASNACDCLLKPVTAERLRSSLEKARRGEPGRSKRSNSTRFEWRIPSNMQMAIEKASRRFR